tara:strand:- start:153 stop:773 length:621 start_codon:yes stop_codon:yes gene_type:complete
MTETEINKLKQAVLERWEDSKSNIVVGLSHLVITLRKELAEKKYSSFDLSTSIPSIHRVKEEAWFAFIETYDKKDRDNYSITESEKAGHKALDKYLEKLKIVNFNEDTQGEKTEKIDWEAGITELAFMFEILFKNSEIGCSMKQYKRRWDLIAKHFTINGEEITSKAIRSAFHETKKNKTTDGRPLKHELYESLLELTTDIKDAKH